MEVACLDDWKWVNFNGANRPSDNSDPSNVSVHISAGKSKSFLRFGSACEIRGLIFFLTFWLELNYGTRSVVSPFEN